MITLELMKIYDDFLYKGYNVPKKMERFWVIEAERRADNSSENYTYSGKYWDHQNRDPVQIKICNGLYYGSFDNETWIQINRNEVFYKSDLVKMMNIYILMWQIIMAQLILLKSVID